MRCPVVLSRPPRRVAVTLVFLATTLLSSLITLACDTPVYRYAMYRWEPAPYEVYRFHEGESDEAARQVRSLLDDWNRSEKEPANVVYVDVDLTKDGALDSIPPDVRKHWQAKPDREGPSYLVVSPIGAPVHDGPLDPETLESLVTSPIRQRIAKRLAAGDACVFVLLSGIAKQGDKVVEDKEATAEARKTLESLVEEVNRGDVKLYSTPTADADAPQTRVGMVQLSRLDEKEQLLVKSLMAVEGDLYDFDNPMVFAIYGRARALPPYIGKGINRNLLVGCVEFVTGQCSCTVKEQNPGVDLLFRHDWQSAAATLAQKFGVEEGNESQIGSEQFFPHLIAPAPAAVAPAETDGTEDDRTSLADAAADDPPAAVDPSAEGQAPETSVAETSVAETSEPETAVDPETTGRDDARERDASASQDSERDDAESATGQSPENTGFADQHDAAARRGDRQVAAVPATATASSQFESVSMTTDVGLWVVVAGIGMGLLVLLGITFAVIRSH